MATDAPAITMESGVLRGHRNDARLQRQKIGVAAAVERHGRHLFSGDHFAHLGAGGFDVYFVAAF